MTAPAEPHWTEADRRDYGGALDWCRAVSRPGTPLTMIMMGRPVVAVATARRNFVCTAAPGHERNHQACDGRGNVLARWPARTDEHYWQPGGCDGCLHAKPPRTQP
jgi:hypothetical protein